MAHALRSADAIRGASTQKGPARALTALLLMVGGKVSEAILGDTGIAPKFGFLSMNVVYTLDAVNTGVGFPHLER
jgi:hypothetical protein